jgi:hypothetical protein
MTPTILLQQERFARQTLRSSPSDATVMDQPTLDEWILGQLQSRGCQPLDQLATVLRPVNWLELFLAIDRLIRSGQIFLWPSDSGDVILSLIRKNLTAPAFPRGQLLAI